MKIKNTVFSKEQLKAIKNANINIDFQKDYSDDELLTLEEKFENLIMDNQFKNVKFYENILDVFQDATK